MKVVGYGAPTEFGKLAETISKWFAPIIRMWRFTKNNRSTSKIVEWEKKKRAKRIKNVLQCPMC